MTIMQVFAVAPSGTRPLLVLVPVVIVLVVVLVVVAFSLLGPGRARFEVSQDGIQLRGDWYRRFIGADQLIIDRARRVDLAPSRTSQREAPPWTREAHA